MSDPHANNDEIPIIVDAYGVRLTLKSKPDDLGEPQPLSWRDVAGQVNRHLMRIAAAPTRLTAELLESTTRLVRGLSRIPSSIASRMRRAHDEADNAEFDHQERIAKGYLGFSSSREMMTEPAVDNEAETALRTIEDLVHKYADKGLDAYVELGADGKIIIVLGAPPKSEREVGEVIKQSERQLEGIVEQDN